MERSIASIIIQSLYIKNSWKLGQIQIAWYLDSMLPALNDYKTQIWSHITSIIIKTWSVSLQSKFQELPHHMKLPVPLSALEK